MSGRGRHVLFVYDGLPPHRKGGAETRLGAIARGLAGRGWRVSWTGLAPPQAPLEQHLDGIHYRKIGTEPGTRRNRRRGLLSQLGYCARLWRCELPGDVDCLVVGQMPWLHFFVIRRRIPARVPILVDCWEIWGSSWTSYYGAILGFFGRRVERRVVRTAEMVASLSGPTRQGLLGHGVEHGRILDAPNGVDLELADQIEVERNPLEIVYFGRLVPHKNVDLLIAAFREVADALPEAILTVIGDGGERPGLEALAERLGLGGRVRFLGSIGDHAEALARLKSASICVQPSTSEGGGSVAIHEANACGLPVVALRHPQGIDPALIVEGVNGFWLDEAAPGPLARLLIGLIEDRPRLERLRRSSRQAAAHLDWSHTVNSFDAALSRLAGPALAGAA